MKLDPQATALIFCLTIGDAEAVASQLEGGVYHADRPIEDRQKVLASFQNGNPRILVCTSALNAGLDSGSVSLVIEFGKPRNIIDFSQHSGRSGRSSQLAFSTIFLDPSQWEWAPKPGQTRIGVQEMDDYVKMRCRRIVLGFMDDDENPRTCLQLATVVLCDVCKKIVLGQSLPKVSQPVTVGQESLHLSSTRKWKPLH